MCACVCANKITLAGEVGPDKDHNKGMYLMLLCLPTLTLTAAGNDQNTNDDEDEVQNASMEIVRRFNSLSLLRRQRFS